MNTCERCILRGLDCLSVDEDLRLAGSSGNATPSSQYAENVVPDAYAIGVLESTHAGHYQMPYIMAQQYDFRSGFMNKPRLKPLVELFH